MAPFLFVCVAKVGIIFQTTKLLKKKVEIFFCSRKKPYLCSAKTESSAVGSALRSGRRGRAFESPLSDKSDDGLAAIAFLFKIYSFHNSKI